ncbi:MAG TPA: hypothetical protein VGA13_03160 [Acidimicrobiales bacterium]
MATPASRSSAGVAVVIDALVRWARRNDTPAVWHAVLLSGDSSTLHAIDESVARTGRRRAALHHDELAMLLAEHEHRVLEDLVLGLDALAVASPERLVATNDPRLGRAAAVAFIRLHDQGLIAESEGVVDACPRCRTVVPDVAASGAVEAERLHIGIPVRTRKGTVEVEVEIDEPELLPGVVALVVPRRHPARKGWATIPFQPGIVPVLADRRATSPQLVIPAHRADDLDVARRHRIGSVEVLGADGVVVAPGPLRGMRRYAARQEARRLLLEEGHLRGGETIAQRVRRCPWCDTAAVARHDRHWLADLHRAGNLAADLVRTDLEVTPGSVRDELIETLRRLGTSSISRPDGVGHPAPASRCGHCGHVEVALDPDACRRCAGPLVSDEGSLDAAFVAALWPMVSVGWPDDPSGPEAAATDTTFVCAPSALPLAAEAMALGLRLTGALPFSRLLVHGRPGIGPHPGANLDLVEMVDRRGRAAVRAGLLLDTDDADEVDRIVNALLDPPEGSGHIDEADRLARTSLSQGHPGAALVALGAAARGGLRSTERKRLAADLEPLLVTEPTRLP